MIVDDYTRYIGCFSCHQRMKPWICLFLSAKLFKMKKGYSISSIRSDHGKEFENLGFDAFCGENGISHNFSASRTPQQNGVV